MADANHKLYKPRPIKDCETLNQIIERLTWEVEQPNSHPIEIYMPLVQAIGRVIQRGRRGRKGAYIIGRLGLPHTFEEGEKA